MVSHGPRSVLRGTEETEGQLLGEEEGGVEDEEEVSTCCYVTARGGHQRNLIMSKLDQ